MIGEQTLRQVGSEVRHFKNINPRNCVDLLLRTAQQHHVALSTMADTKASIIITVSSIVMTISLSRSSDPHLRPALMTLAISCLVALVLAIVAVLPTFKKRSGPRNLLFFGHFAEMTEEEYMTAMEQILSSDARIYETQLRDLHSLGTYLHRKKYRFLRYAYMALLFGFIFATVVEAWVFIRYP